MSEKTERLPAVAAAVMAAALAGAGCDTGCDKDGEAKIAQLVYDYHQEVDQICSRLMGEGVGRRGVVYYRTRDTIDIGGLMVGYAPQAATEAVGCGSGRSTDEADNNAKAEAVGPLVQHLRDLMKDGAFEFCVQPSPQRSMFFRGSGLSAFVSAVRVAPGKCEKPADAPQAPLPPNSPQSAPAGDAGTARLYIRLHRP